MSKDKVWVPCWLYRLDANNEVEARIFEDGPPEEKGWQDAPPKKRGRPAGSKGKAKAEDSEECAPA